MGIQFNAKLALDMGHMRDKESHIIHNDIALTFNY
jgi:hypothetical protein